MHKPFQLFSLSRFHFLKSELEQLLFVSCFFSIALALFRVVYTGQWLFIWLSWNLLLALVPYLLTRFAIFHPAWIEHRIKFAVVFIAWLLFIPNSFYIITDLFHLDARHSIPLWFDLVLIFSFAWNGILLGVASIRQMEKMIQLKLPAMKEWQFVYPMMMLNAVGIYIGRYLRYNSWDIIANPFDLAGDVFFLLMHPVQNRFEWSMIICYTVFMSLIYTAIKRMSKALW